MMWTITILFEKYKFIMQVTHIEQQQTNIFCLLNLAAYIILIILLYN